MGHRLFGTTRTHLVSSSQTQTGTATQIHIFAFKLGLASKKPPQDNNKFYIKRLLATSYDTYVTGISNDILAGNIFHLIMFDPLADKLWYFKADTMSTSAGIALLI